MSVNVVPQPQQPELQDELTAAGYSPERLSKLIVLPEIHSDFSQARTSCRQPSKSSGMLWRPPESIELLEWPGLTGRTQGTRRDPAPPRLWHSFVPVFEVCFNDWTCDILSRTGTKSRGSPVRVSQLVNVENERPLPTSPCRPGRRQF